MDGRPLSTISRRRLISLGVGVAGWALGGGALAISPMDRRRSPHLKLSLAAYSFRNYLPNYRKGSPDGNEPLDMMGFIDYCAKLDLDGAELTSYFLPSPCPPSLAMALKKRAHLQGVDISGGAIGNNFALEPGPELDEQLAYTEQWIRAYSLMGATVIRVFGGKPKKGGPTGAKAEEYIVQNLRRACEFAGKYGVILAIENHDFLTDIDRFLRIVEAVDSPWFGVNLDSGNFGSTPDPYREFDKAIPYAVNVQLKTKIPRNGVKEDADFEKLIGLLKKSAYRGYVVLEYEDEEDPYGAIPRLVGELRPLLT